ncbi:MAG: glycosyltransferase family 2 protein [Sphingomonas sp.]|nr:glycosyltransferase family 2 protein [Sphingomonas sp.]
MPLYNRAATVKAAIDSVLRQTFPDFELVVVDDASTDGGTEIAGNFADERIRLVRLPQNRGGNAARNAGIRLARGRILSFLDSDDEFMPHKLEVIVGILKSGEFEGVIDSYRKLYPTRSNRTKDCINPKLEAEDAILKALFNRRIWKSTPGISVTAQAALRAGLFDEGLRRRQDFDFLVRLARSAKVISVPTITWLKHRTDDSITANLSGFMASLMEFWDRHPEYYDNPDFRPGFAADITLHLSKLFITGRLRQLVMDAATVARRIGYPSLCTSIVVGTRELLRLKRHRTGIGGEHG